MHELRLETCPHVVVGEVMKCRFILIEGIEKTSRTGIYSPELGFCDLALNVSGGPR